MPRDLRLAYFAHSLRSDWNNGNAHFLRGLLRAFRNLGPEVTVFEPAQGWSIDHLREEPAGEKSIADFHTLYPDLTISTYSESARMEPAVARQPLTRPAQRTRLPPAFARHPPSRLIVARADSQLRHGPVRWGPGIRRSIEFHLPRRVRHSPRLDSPRGGGYHNLSPCWSA